MRKYCWLLLSLALFGACEQRAEFAAPASGPEENAETATTILAAPPRRSPRIKLSSFVESLVLLPLSSPNPLKELRTSSLPAPDIKITDKSNEIATEETLAPVNIAFNTPESMSYGETTSIHLVLDLTKSRAELETMVLREAPGPVASEQVNITHVVEAKLTGDAFDITPVSDAEQVVSEKTVTRWVWDVRPKRFSTQLLHLSLSNRLPVEGKEKAQYLPVFHKKIVVRVNSFGSAFAAAKDNWQIVTATTASLGGLLTWVVALIRRRRLAIS